MARGPLLFARVVRPVRSLWQRFAFATLIGMALSLMIADEVDIKVFKEFGLFDEKLNSIMDYEWFFRISDSKKKISCFYYDYPIASFKLGGKSYKLTVKYYDDESTPARGAQLAERLESS